MADQTEKKDYDHLVKILFVGGAQNGKTELLQSIAGEKFFEKYLATIGVDFKIKTFVKNNVTVKAQMWDTSGQERFRNYTLSYFKGVGLIFVCVDLSKDLESQQAQMKSYETDIRELAEGAKVVVLGLKFDIQICHDQLQKFCTEQKLCYFATSAKTKFNVPNAILKSLDTMKLFGPVFDLPPLEFADTTQSIQIGFFGTVYNLFLAKSCFYEVEPQKFLQKIDGQVVEFAEGDQVYVCDEEIDLEMANRAKCVLMISTDKYLQKPRDLQLPVFVINQVGDIEKTFQNMMQLGK